MVARYKIRHPLENEPDVRVFSVSDRYDPERRKVLTILPAQPRTWQELCRFEREYRRRLSLRHPLLPGLLDLALRGKKIGVVTAQHTGHLDERISTRSRLKGDLRILRQLAELAAYLHNNGFCWRYITPSKLFWEDGKLLVNLLLSCEAPLAGEPKPAVGRYAAPELLLGEPPTQATDMYSLGMLFYFLSTGQQPFAEEDPDILRQKQLSARPTPPRQLNPRLRMAVEETITALVDKDPSRRPSASDVCARLNPKTSRSAPAPRIGSPLVGRRKELRSLQEMLRRKATKPGVRFACVSGTSGMGKTYLVKAVEPVAKALDHVCFSVHHSPDDIALQPFRGIADQVALLTENDRAATGSNKLSTTDLTDVLLEGLTELCRHKRVFFRASDLQWMDEGSYQFYRRLVLRDEFGIVVVGDCRTDEEDAGYWPELKSDLAANGRLTEIDLAPLDGGESLELVSRLLGEIPSEIRQASILANCGGNPYYIVELVRWLRASGEIGFRRGGWYPVRGEIALQGIPESVHSRLAERTARLGRESKKLLEWIALLGSPVQMEILAELTGSEPAAVGDRLYELERLDLVSVSGAFDEPCFRLSHDWVRRVAIDAIPERRRQVMHCGIAEVLEKRLSEESPADAATPITRHALRGNDAKRVDKFLPASLAALKSSHLYRDACELLQESIRRGFQKLDDWTVAQELLELLFQAGEVEEVIQVARSILERGKVEGREKTYCHWSLARGLATLGFNLEAVEWLRQALEEGSQVDKLLRAQVRGDLIILHTRTGEKALASELIDELTRDKTNVGRPGEEKSCHALYCYLRTGPPEDSKKAIRFETQAIRLALKEGNLPRAVGRCSNLAEYHFRAGNWWLASRLLRFCLSTSRHIGNPELLRFSRSAELVYLRKHGLHSAAVSLARRLKYGSTNRHLAREWKAELAKNLTHQMSLRKAEKILISLAGRQTEDESLSFELNYWLGRLYLHLHQYHRVEKCLKTLKRFRCVPIFGRRYLLETLYSQVRGDLGKSLSTCERALDFFTEAFPHERTRGLLQKAEILLKDPQLGEPLPVASEALTTAREHYYPPLLAEAYCSYGRALALKGRLGDGKIFCLRGLQVAKQVERPGLVSGLLANLGRLQVELGERSQALESFDRALEALGSPLVEIPKKYRSAFYKKWMRPVEKDRSRLVTRSIERPEPMMIHLRKFTKTVREDLDARTVAKQLGLTIRAALNKFNLRLFWSEDLGEKFDLLSAYGKISESSQPLLDKAMTSDGMLLTVGEERADATPALGLKVRLSGTQLCVIHLEAKPGRSAAEIDLDFLVEMGEIAEMSGDRKSLPEETTKSAVGLELADGRVLAGKHGSMRQLFEQIKRIAGAQATVLVYGESGTGKELVARAIHDYSARKHRDFLPLNCSALPGELVENELFGHVRGSFTGASKSKIGLFEAASGGTLFLDEIATMSLATQARLLRVLEEKRVRRIGDTREREVDVRVVAASNQPLEKLISKGEFRADLYHRLNVVSFELPPLRERISDIPLLVSIFLDHLKAENKTNKRLTPEALKTLRSYSFPGNVRELKNVVESLYFLSPGAKIGRDLVLSALNPDKVEADTASKDIAAQLYSGLIDGRLDFWEGIKKPFLKRELARREVRAVVAKGLRACDGVYLDVVRHFGLPPEDYKRFLAFLRQQQLVVDFRPYRKRSASK